ncbi:MAG: phage integrase SAM-like domain-containing protein, partial [Romboutsia sp.]|nr:phage integrase SAM-like domain-containing protein [Romboutsia sp.]
MSNISEEEKIKLKNEFLSNKTISHMLLKHIYGFKYVLQKSNKYSKRTEHILINNIELFGKYLYLYHPTLMLKDINEEVIKKYRNFCKDILGNSPKTVNKKLSSLSTFWDYLVNDDYDKQYFKYNIIKNVPFLALDKEKFPTIIKTSELLRLFDSMRTSLYGCRDICICKIILETGLPL